MAQPATTSQPNQPSGKIERRLQHVQPKPVPEPKPEKAPPIQAPPVPQKPQPRAPLEMMRALQMESGRQRPSNDNGRSGDTRISDDSNPGEGQRGSVLDLGRGPKSYTDAQKEDVEEPMAGGGYMEQPWMEMERMKQEDAKKRAVQAQLLGDDVSGLNAPASSMQDTTEETEEREEGEEEGETEEAQRSEIERLEQLNADQIATEREQEKEDMKKRASDEMKQQIKARRDKIKASGKTARYTSEGAEIFTSEFIVPLLILLAQLNLQMFWKYFMKRENETGTREKISAFLDQSIWEDVLTISLDFLVFINVVVFNPVSLTIIIIVCAIQFIPGLETTMKVVKIIQDVFN